MKNWQVRTINVFIYAGIGLGYTIGALLLLAIIVCLYMG